MTIKTKPEIETVEATTGTVVEEQAVEQQSANLPTPDGPTEAQMKARIAELEGILDVHRTEEAAQAGTVMKFGVRIKEGTVLRDPFTSQNPVSIKENPPGLRLSWCNPALRERIGWKGWQPVKYDSDIGENLSTYLMDPPARMEGVIQADNYVRRGKTSVLCSIPEEVWLKRQIETEAKSDRRQQHLRTPGTDLIRPDGTVVVAGEGLTTEERPMGGFRMRHEQGERAPVGKDDGVQRVRDFLPLDDPTLHNTQ